MSLEPTNKLTPQQKVDIIKQVHSDLAPGLMNFYANLIGEPLIKQDIVAEAIALLWQKEFNYTTPDEKKILKGYLYRTVRNMALKELRKNIQRTIAEKTWSNAHDTEELREAEEDALTVTATYTNLLPPELADIWHLLYIKELTSAEAAKVLGVKIDVVYEAHRKLKRQVEAMLRKKNIPPYFLKLLFLGTY